MKVTYSNFCMCNKFMWNCIDIDAVETDSAASHTRETLSITWELTQFIKSLEYQREEQSASSRLVTEAIKKPFMRQHQVSLRWIQVVYTDYHLGKYSAANFSSLGFKYMHFLHQVAILHVHITLS